MIRAAALALVFTALAGPAFAAHPLADAFSDLCLSKGAPAARVAKADAAGWAPLPDAMLTEMMKTDSMSVRELSGRAHVIDKAFYMLMVGTANMPMEGERQVMESQVCAIMTFAKAGGAIRKDLTAQFGAVPMNMGADDPEMKGSFAWMFIEQGGTRRFMGMEDGMAVVRAMSEGRLTMLIVSEEDGMTMLMLMRPVMGMAN